MMPTALHRRIDFIDLTKGLCIILVIMTHVGGVFSPACDSAWMQCFLMPLYFFVSGLFFKSYDGFGDFLIRKINNLLIPFVVFYVGSFLLMWGLSKALPGVFQLPVQWNELLLVFDRHALIRYNPPIWFLVALFNCCILFYLIHYLRDKHLPLFFLLSLLLSFAGFWLGKHRIELPLYLDVAMAALPFYLAGFWIRRYNFFLFPYHRFDKLIPLLVVAAALVLFFTAQPVGMRTNTYFGNLFQTYVSAFAGIFTIMLLCKRIKHIGVVSYLGRYSIAALGIHGPLLHFFRPILEHLTSHLWIQSTLMLFIVLLTCILLTPVIVRFMPWIPVAESKE